jgi:glutathione S-transferase
MRALLPDDANARARAINLMFAALNTVEPPIVEREAVTYLERDKAWYAERLPMLEERIHVRLHQLSSRLGNADWLDGGFSAGDWKRRASWRSIRSFSLISPAAKRGRPINARSPISWRCSPAHRPPDRNSARTANLLEGA